MVPGLSFGKAQIAKPLGPHYKWQETAASAGSSVISNRASPTNPDGGMLR